MTSYEASCLVEIQDKMNFQILLVIFIASYSSFCGSTRQTLTDRPIIGIVAQSVEGTPVEGLGKSYIDAAYVKYIESSGARVAPIMTNLTKEEIIKIFRSVNGVLFPGGDVSVTESDYARIGRTIYKLAKEAFDNNDYFPLWGTCLGFELLSVITSGSSDVLSQCDSDNLNIPLNFTTSYRNSRLFAEISVDLAKFMSSMPTTLNLHHFGVYESTFKTNKRLSAFFHVLSTNFDRKGNKFISTIEAVKYPFYGTQWHPEKNSFEWTLNQNIPHRAMSIKVTQYMSNFFVNEARYNKHKFKTIEEEQAALIYNYDPVYTGDISNWEQSYIFK